MPAARGRDSRALPARRRRSSRRSSGASSSATGTRRSSRPSITAHRELQAVDPDALSDEELAAYLHALPRPPRGDDLPAHALTPRAAIVADGRLPRPCRRLDRPAARRTARPDARRLARLGRRLGRARAADRRDRGGPARAAAARLGRTTPARVLEALRSLDGDGGRRACPPTSTSSATGSSTASTSRSRYALELPDVAAAGDPRRRRRDGRRGVGRRGPDRRRARRRCPRSIGPSSTSCSARRG